MLKKKNRSGINENFFNSKWVNGLEEDLGPHFGVFQQGKRGEGMINVNVANYLLL